MNNLHDEDFKYPIDKDSAKAIAEELKRIAKESEIKICTECYSVIEGKPKHKLMYGNLKEICTSCWLNMRR